MNARLIFAALLGVALGGGAVSPRPLHRAPAPGPKLGRWGYKGVSYAGSLPRESNPGDKVAQQLNTLAQDGGESAGPVAPRSARGGTIAGQYVAFRRSKP